MTPRKIIKHFRGECFHRFNGIDLFFIWVLFIWPLFFGALFQCTDAMADTVGEIVLMQGEVTQQKGRLEFQEWAPGDSLKTNYFHQYRGQREETKSKIIWEQTSKAQTLIVGDKIEQGSVIATNSNARTRILLADDTILDLGNDTLICVKEWEQNAERRNVNIQLYQGKLRVLVTKHLKGQSRFRVSSPGLNTWVRGTDFVVHVSQPTSEFAGPVKTWVLGVRGQVTSDVIRLSNEGEAYFQTYIINTYSVLTTQSADGYVLKSALQDQLSSQNFSDATEEHSPFTEVYTGIISLTPPADQLRGASDSTFRSVPDATRDTSLLFANTPSLWQPYMAERPPYSVLKTLSTLTSGLK